MQGKMKIRGNIMKAIEAEAGAGPKQAEGPHLINLIEIGE